MNTRTDTPDATRAFADFAFGSQTQVADASRPLAWLSPEELEIDLSDPVARRFGDYELLEKIGQGGMGVVYRARQHGLERDVALKLLAAGPWASDEFVARFRREARSAARMQHPNIVEIFEFGHRDGLNYFSMRLIEGQSLAQKLHVTGPLPAKEAAALLRTLAEAMDYAHRLGVLHLDLKPANVLLNASGTPLIADFGLARRIDAGHEGGNGEISGTPSYMAPEQALLESHPLSASTDIYGLGAVLYECLIGRAPFIGIDAQKVLERVVTETPVAPSTLRRDVPADLEAICLKCLEKNPAQRYATARELADDLGRFIDNRPVSVRPLGRAQRAWRWARREPRVAAAAGLAALALLAGAMATTWQWRQAVAQRNSAVAAEQGAKAERDRARIASEIGAHLFAYHGDDRANDLIVWLEKRLPGDETRQAEALAAFAASVEKESPEDADDLADLVLAIIRTLGADYRKRMIASLQAGSDPYRDLYSAILATSDKDVAGADARIDAFLRAATTRLPDDAFVQHTASLYCPGADPKRCRYEQTAQALVRIDPDNMYHWLLVTMWSTDAARRREALHEAAKRTRYDDYLGQEILAYGKAIDAAAIPVPPLVVQAARVYAPNARPETTLAVFGAGEAPIASWQHLVKFCVPTDLDTLDPQVRADCLAVGTRLARSDGALIAKMIGVAIVRPLARGTPLADEMLQLRRHYAYLTAMDATVGRRQRLTFPMAQYLDDFAAIGEMKAIQRQVEFFGMPGQPPADWQPEDPSRLMSGRERRDRMVDTTNQGRSLVAQGRYDDAIELLVSTEAGMRLYATDDETWRLAKHLSTLGQARTRRGLYADAEKNLLEAWKIAEAFGPDSSDARRCLDALVELHTAWHRAEPGQGHDAKVAEWKRTREEYLVGAEWRVGESPRAR